MENEIKEKRNYSIDLLRILSMMMIIIMHQMSHGGGVPQYIAKYQ